MANTKKISINAFEKVMKATYVPTEIIEWNDIEITIKKTLSLKDMLGFVDTVVKSCFEKDTGIYMPEIKDFVTKLCILEKYSNFKLPTSTELKYDLIYCTDAVECVMSHVNIKQLSEIINAINKKLDHVAQANIEAVNKQMNELCNSFNNLQNQVSSIFDGVDSNDIKTVTNALVNGGIDEEKLVKAYINQKSK